MPAHFRLSAVKNRKQNKNQEFSVIRYIFRYISQDYALDIDDNRCIIAVIDLDCVMNEAEIIDIVRHAILVTLQMAVPVLAIGLIVGVSIALVQALTQVQEMTLVFVPKIIAIYLALFFLFPTMVSILISFTESLFQQIVNIQ